MVTFPSGWDEIMNKKPYRSLRGISEVGLLVCREGLIFYAKRVAE